MTTKNDTLHGIQARIEELQKTIAEKEKQIKARTRNLKQDIAEELSPEEIVKKHPFLAAGTTFTAGLILTKSIAGRKKSTAPAQASQPALQPEPPASRRKGMMYAIGPDLFDSVKDIGFKYLQGYIENKFGRQGRNRKG